MIEHDSDEQAKAAFRKAFDDAGENWMGVLFKATPDGRIQTHRTTYDFPRDQFLVAVTELAKQLVEEDRIDEPGPLPVAPFLRRKSCGMKLFDGKEVGDVQ